MVDEKCVPRPLLFLPVTIGERGHHTEPTEGGGKGNREVITPRGYLVDYFTRDLKVPDLSVRLRR